VTTPHFLFYLITVVLFTIKGRVSNDLFSVMQFPWRAPSPPLYLPSCLSSIAGHPRASVAMCRAGLVCGVLRKKGAKETTPVRALVVGEAPTPFTI